MQAIHHWQCWFCCEWILNYKSLVLRCNAISVLGERKLLRMVETCFLGLLNFVWSGKNAFRVCFSVYQILFWKGESAFRVVEYKMSLHCLLQRLVDQVLCNLKIYKSALPKRYGPLPVTPTKYKAPRCPTTLSLCKYANFIPALQVKKLRWKWRNKKHMKY